MESVKEDRGGRSSSCRGDPREAGPTGMDPPHTEKEDLVGGVRGPQRMHPETKESAFALLK